MSPMLRRSLFAPAMRLSTRRHLSTTSRLLNSSSGSVDAGALPVQKPVGAFRGGLFGFLLGTTVAGASVYYYILDEYRVSNEMLTEDIYALQAATQRLNAYVTDLEGKLDLLQKKK
ncbi:hypothetical protein PABG_11394 [Paracoccidioides brasiliensis Pb03]|uniref:Uncharacterized protein n=1 Tax=Paracoccidioides brasiliensis (strain Pb18) TaxID=502780 RepID=C1G905_PARBD|nr:uncharacterized protein PADG_03741 [Paracoccidioides brasiliensis Pb18]EEH47657.1 hypothetical protein PADG_03741 [Paracoccidioides brasiliensis Pb18]KGY15738.1 hypothetical protein PABG_11394 [Paracoccidioides brasiliensis Pb03]ODH49741.1 hypothetical protein GX48_04119 [Paracoccidioides brasiliensis]